ncbi:hypothetical protein [Streptomyces sp. NBC_00576]|nr:hypothetical protein [Streptomyces sp. NBC_00576]WUB76206.1 hypothetical protein OG734_42600 [Streptomyces sp. NBC_00576]
MHFTEYPQQVSSRAQSQADTLAMIDPDNLRSEAGSDVGDGSDHSTGRVQ